MPFPDRRHLLGRLLKQPWRASLVWPAKLFPWGHGALLVLARSEQQRCRISHCTLRATVGDGDGLKTVGLRAATPRPPSGFSAASPVVAVAASRQTQRDVVTNPPYDSRRDKGKPADGLEPPCRHALCPRLLLRCASTDNGCHGDSPLPKTPSLAVCNALVSSRSLCGPSDASAACLRVRCAQSRRPNA